MHMIVLFEYVAVMLYDVAATADVEGRLVVDTYIVREVQRACGQSTSLWPLNS